MNAIRYILCFIMAMTASLRMNAQSPTSAAQRPAYYKMSSFVREACRSAVHNPDVNRVSANHPSTMIAFVKLTDDNTETLTAHGCKVLARYGRLCIAEIPLNAIGPLSLDNRVSRIEAGRRATALMDTTRIIVNANPVQQGINLPQKFTGKGVVVGVQDIGFDLTHPTFWSSDMSTYRIKAMWDQLSYDTLTSTLPVGRDYVGKDELLAVQHPRDGLLQTHGTHTTGIAAGSGAEGGGELSPYSGIAPDADICLVCNGTSNDAELIDPKDYYRYTYAVDALGFKYIFDYADRVGRPCVINFSEGSGMDFRGDDQLYYEMLDSLTGPGHIIVASAGNFGGTVKYIRKDPSTSTKSINCYKSSSRSFMVTTRSKGDFTFTVRQKKGNDEMHVAIPLSKVLTSIDSTYTDSIIGNGTRTKVIGNAYHSCYDSSDIICDWQITRDTASIAVDNQWRLVFDISGDGLVELFQSSGQLYNDDWHLREGDNAYSVNSPGSAPSVICVGSTAYRGTVKNYLGETMGITLAERGLRADYSSVGPTFDERIKPDVMAPGLLVISSYSSFGNWGHNGSGTYNVRYFNYNGREYYWNADTGTSMSAPVVTGVIALWLQACPTLTPDDCREIFARTCRHNDESLTYPNNFYGYGEIDAAAGLRLILEKVAAGIHNVNTTRPTDDRIFSIDGTYVGKDASRLPHGLYIRNGKKFVL